MSAKGDDLERIRAPVDFEMFRPDLEAAAPRADRSRGGSPLILQAMHALSDRPMRRSRKSARRSSMSLRIRLMGLYVRTIGIARAKVKIGLANMDYNMCRLVWLQSRMVTA